MKIRVAILLILALFDFIHAERIGLLEGVLKPQMIEVDGDELFVAEGQYIFVYSLPELKMKFRIGKDGEGPGEFKLDPARTIIFSVHSKFILAESRNKIVYFDRSGRFIKEKRKRPGILQVLPLGGNFAVLRIHYGQEGESYFVASVMDAEFNEIRAVYRQKFFNFKGKIHAIPDGLNLCVSGDRLYVEESPDGFVIEVFDPLGKRISRMDRKHAPEIVTAAHREKGLADLMKIPALLRAAREQGRTKVLNDLKPNLVYPDHLPAIAYMMVGAKGIDIKTPLRNAGKAEFLHLDWDGTRIGTQYLPEAKTVDFLVRMQGDKNYFTIHDDKYYYLKFRESEDDEAWEVHAESLQP